MLQPCPFCRREGFVRAERVITAATSMTQYFCGLCLKEWQGPEPPYTPAAPQKQAIREA